MSYVYDILLNFTDSKKLFDFFEWEEDDNILNIKKIPIFKVSKSMLYDLFNYKIKFNNDFLKKIDNNSSIYKQGKKYYKYLSLFTDGDKVIGVSLNNNGITEYKSSLLIDEEEDISLSMEKIEIEEINYKKLEKENRELFITRKEEEEKEFLIKEINNLYKNNNIEKLKYLYIEFFNKKEDNIDYVYKSLLNSLKDMDDRHEILYNLLKMTCKNYR